MTAKRLRLLSIGHAYVVALNRRLVRALAAEGGEAWEVTAAAPRSFRGDLAPLELRVEPSEPAPVIPLPAHLTRSPHAFFYGRGLSEALGRGWDLVHCWEEPFVAAGAEVAWRMPGGTPLVYTTNQNLPKDYPIPFRSFERFALRRAAGWIGCGRTVMESLGRRPGWNERPGRCIPYGVDPTVFRPDAASRRAILEKLGWTKGAPVVGYLGRFVPEKGVAFLMGVLDRIAAPWRALFVGGGPLEGALREWAARHGEKVRLATDVPHDAVPAYLNAMDLLAAPSQTTPRWKEQFGRMLIEAFATGVPVVGSDSGEIPHVLGAAGLVAGEADVDAWVAAVGELLDSPARRRDLGERGLERVREAFAWPVVARQHLDFFAERLATGEPRVTR